MTVLVTGSTGFTGTALLRYLVSSGIQEIAGTARSLPDNGIRFPDVPFFSCDLTDAQQTTRLISTIEPDYVIHLAGLTRGSQEELNRVNGKGTKILLDTIGHVNPGCRILITSSSAVYGYSGKEPVREESPLLPLGEYGVSKVRQEQIVKDSYATQGANVVLVRPFNLVGPGQPDSFVCGKVVKQVAEIAQGTRRTLELLETRSYRDFVDVRDAVRAYWALVSHPDFNTACAGKAFNIASGKARSISDVVSLLETITGRTYIVDLPENPPVIPVPFQQGDTTRIRSAVGWRPEITLYQSLADMLNAVH